jgi:hypothetical protein
LLFHIRLVPLHVGTTLSESASAAAGPLLEALFGDPALSEVGVSEGGNRGLGLPSLVVPSLQRVYFKFGEPLEASAFVGGPDKTDGFEGGTDELAAAVGLCRLN